MLVRFASPEDLLHQVRPLTATLLAAPFFLFAALAIWLQLRNSLTVSETGPVEFADTSFSWALALMLTLIAAVKWRSDGNIAVRWLLLALAGWAWLAANLAQIEDSFLPRIVPDDILTLVVWALVIWAIVPALGDRNLSSSSKLLWGFGLILQSIAFVADLGDGSIFHFPGGSYPLMSSVDESFETLCLAAYVGGLVLMAVPLLFATPGVAGRWAWQFLRSTPGRLAAIAWEEVSFGVWQLRHRNAPFADYYAQKFQRSLDRGTPHRTLGQHSWSSQASVFSQGDRIGRFAEEGVQTFMEIAALFPQLSGPVVDYGCGSLRIGQHFIKLLGPGAYWGLDITDRFFKDGAAMLPSQLLAAKAPELHVIGKDSLARAAAAKPQLVYSVAVMKLVPSAELDTYWRNILGLLQPGSLAVVYFDVAEKEMRTAGMNWAYRESQLRELAGRIVPGMSLRFEILGQTSRFAGIPFNYARVIAGPMVAGT